MQGEGLYDAIFHRISVRKFSPDPLSAERIGEITRWMGEIPSLTGQGRAVLDILSPTQVSRAIAGPHYAAVYCGEDKVSVLEAGHRLQYLSLFLFGQGIGSCFSASAAPHPQRRQREDLSAKILMVFGAPAQESRRTGPGAFDRKPPGEILSGDVSRFLAEAVRVAPSAWNTQPWHLSGARDDIEVYYSPRGLMARLMSGMAYIDMGIALCHLRVAAEKQGMACDFDFDAVQSGSSERKRELICRVKLT